MSRKSSGDFVKPIINILCRNTMASVLIVLASCASRNGSNRIAEVYVASKNWTSEAAFIPFTVDHVLQTPNKYEATIKDSAAIAHIGMAIYDIPQRDASDIDYIDVRTVCLVKHISGKNDTLSFGASGMQYEGKYYSLDTSLLLYLVDYLPEKAHKGFRNLEK